jgi:tetraacyldisaccharide 4'-kinase
MTAQLGCPVVVDPDRSRGVSYLLANHRLDVVLTDDGLQHYRLHRDIEIAVVDASRGLGNRRLLPTGPLREPIQRLHEVDFVIANGDAAEVEADAQIQLLPQRFRNLANGREVAPARWDQGRAVNAVAAIGNPQRFATTLELLGLDAKLHAKDDHRPLCLTDLLFDDNKPVIITAKDAVKLVGSVADNVWVLDVETVLPSQFIEQLLQRLHSFKQLET